MWKCIWKSVFILKYKIVFILALYVSLILLLGVQKECRRITLSRSSSSNFPFIQKLPSANSIYAAWLYWMVKLNTAYLWITFVPHMQSCCPQEMCLEIVMVQDIAFTSFLIIKNSVFFSSLDVFIKSIHLCSPCCGYMWGINF